MEGNEQLLKFKNIDLVEYINKKHVKMDLIEIESEKNVIVNLLKTANEDIFQYFLQRQEPLLKLLETSQECYKIIKTFKNTQKERIEQQQEDELCSSELKKKLNLFKDDMSIFLTPDRYFIASSIFNEGRVICILTNDILFLGEKEEKKEDKKFKLKRSMNKEAIKLETEEDVLKILMDGSICELKGSKVDIDNFFESFQEILYKFEPDINKIEPDYELVKYYLETCDYTTLVDYLESYDKSSDDKLSSILDGVEIDDEFTMFALGKISGNLPKFCKKFFYERFKMGLATINNIQRLDKYISDIFEFIQDFSKEFYKYSEREPLTKRVYVLTMEECIKYAMHYIEPRLINHIKIKDAEEDKEFMKYILDKLTFSNLNFKYLIKEIDCQKPVKQGLIEKDKLRIKEEVEKYLNSK